MTAFEGHARGEISLNGKPLDSAAFKESCYYVEQADKHWACLTCREIISYSAQLYQGKSSAEVAEFVDSIMVKTGLTSCKVCAGYM